MRFFFLRTKFPLSCVIITPRPAFRTILNLSFLAFFCLFAKNLPAQAEKNVHVMEKRPAKLNEVSTKETSVKISNKEAVMQVTLQFPKGEPKLGKLFDVMICNSWTQEKRQNIPVAATSEIEVVMPEHAHGMTVKPRKNETRALQKASEPNCTIWTGLRFDMAGWWRITAITETHNKTFFDFDLAAK